MSFLESRQESPTFITGISAFHPGYLRVSPYIGFVSSFSGIPKDKVLEDIRKDVNEYRLVLIGMAKFEQGIRWINPVCIDRLDKALARAEFKNRR